MSYLDILRHVEPVTSQLLRDGIAALKLAPDDPRAALADEVLARLPAVSKTRAVLDAMKEGDT